MKATIDIPDDLYRRVEAKSAREGRPVRAVAIELFERWLDQQESSTGRSRAQRLSDWFHLADEAFKDARPGPTAREILEQDRSRLERR